MHTTYYTRIRPHSAYRAAYARMHAYRGQTSPEVRKVAQSRGRLTGGAVGGSCRPAGSTQTPKLNSNHSQGVDNFVFARSLGVFSRKPPIHLLFFLPFHRILRGVNQRTVVCSTFSPSLSQVAIAYAVLYAYHSCVCIQLHTYAPSRVLHDSRRRRSDPPPPYEDGCTAVTTHSARETYCQHHHHHGSYVVRVCMLHYASLVL